MARRDPNMAHDVFISYASKDKPKADAACAVLESRGIRCWIAPRDVLPGRPYGEAILDAIHGCRVMVLILSSHANESLHIPKEVERAVSRGVTVVPLRIEDVTPGKSLDYFIGSVHWLDALTPPLEQHLENLVTTVQRLLPERSEIPEVVGAGRVAWSSNPASPVSSTREGHATSGSHTAPRLSSRLIYLAATAAVLLIVVGVGLWRRSEPTSVQSASPANSVAVAKPQLAAATPVTIAGCWKWFNGAIVAASGDGNMTLGTISAQWRLVSSAERTYEISWSTGFVDTVRIAPDGQSLAGQDPEGDQVSAVRSAEPCQMPPRAPSQSRPQQQDLSADQNSQGTTGTHPGSSLRKTGKSILKHLTE